MELRAISVADLLKCAKNLRDSDIQYACIELNAPNDPIFYARIEPYSRELFSAKSPNREKYAVSTPALLAKAKELARDGFEYIQIEFLEADEFEPDVLPASLTFIGIDPSFPEADFECGWIPVLNAATLSD